MNNLELQEQIAQDISKISYDNLKIVAEFVRFIKQQQETNLQETNVSEQINYRPASGHSILDNIGKWEGNDLQECLNLMYKTRGKVTFNNHINPFE